MTVPWDVVEPLAEHHPINEFTSGRESVDTWFREKARGAAHLTATYVCLDSGGAVCGFFALRAAIVNVSGLPGVLKRAGDADGLAPAVMLAQMGLHKDHHGDGHGSASSLEPLSKPRLLIQPSAYGCWCSTPQTTASSPSTSSSE